NSGGMGRDTFVLALGEGTDLIQDFVLGTDLIGLAGGLTFGSLSVSAKGDNTLIAAGDEVLAELVGVSGLGESSFVAGLA
ncbi:MAG: hypothetical protein AAFS04_08230, partial [Cyanobacteria bacterium J06631_9]